MRGYITVQRRPRMRRVIRYRKHVVLPRKVVWAERALLSIV